MMTLRDRPERASVFWCQQLVAKSQVEALLSEAHLRSFRGDFGNCSEAAKLTLAAILSAAAHRQRSRLDEHPRTSAAEYKLVAEKAAELDELVKSLQNRQDPPPLLPAKRNGRNEWDAWAMLELPDAEHRGAKRSVDKKALRQLLAFYEGALSADGLRLSRKEHCPLRTFLRVSFCCAKEAFWTLVEDPTHRKAYMLGEPTYSVIVVERNSNALAGARKAVSKIFETFTQQLSCRSQ